MNLKEKVCVICDGTLEKNLLTITNPDRFERAVGIHKEGYKRSWVECSSCGVATNIHDPKNTEKLKVIEDSYYNIDFQNTSITEKFKKVMGLPAHKSDNAQRVKRIQLFMEGWLRYKGLHSKKMRILDVGAGIGVFLARFLETWKDSFQSFSKLEVIALESDPLACKHLRALSLFKVCEETFPGPTKLKNVTLCTLNKIVEHIQNPVPFLQKTKMVLNDKYGVLYVELPDKATIFHRPQKDNILGALHYHLYDPRSIVILLEKAGLVPIQVMRFFEPSGKITVAAFATLPSAFSIE